MILSRRIVVAALALSSTLAAAITIAACDADVVDDESGDADVDAFSEVGAGDAGPGADGASDATLPPLVIRFCDSIVPTPLFCCDFEGADDLSKFNAQNAGSEGKSSIEEANAITPTRDLLAQVVAQDAGEKAYRGIQITSPVTRLRLSFDFRVDAPKVDAGQGNIHVGRFQLADVGASLLIGADGKLAVVVPVTGTTAVDGGITLDAWHHVDVINDRTGASVQVKVALDGIQIYAQSAPKVAGAANVNFYGGIYSVDDPGGAWTVHVDDMLVAEP